MKLICNLYGRRSEYGRKKKIKKNNEINALATQTSPEKPKLNINHDIWTANNGHNHNQVISHNLILIFGRKNIYSENGRIRLSMDVKRGPHAIYFWALTSTEKNVSVYDSDEKTNLSLTAQLVQTVNLNIKKL